MSRSRIYTTADAAAPRSTNIDIATIARMGVAPTRKQIAAPAMATTPASEQRSLERRISNTPNNTGIVTNSVNNANRKLSREKPRVATRDRIETTAAAAIVVFGQRAQISALIAMPMTESCVAREGPSPITQRSTSNAATTTTAKPRRSAVPSELSMRVAPVSLTSVFKGTSRRYRVPYRAEIGRKDDRGVPRTVPSVDVVRRRDPDDGSMHPLLIRQPVLTRITANIGAQIEGLDLSRRLGPTEVDLLRSAIAEHLVVVVRAQFLSASQLADVAGSFAPILRSPVHAVTGDHRSVSTIEDTATRPPAGFPWHSDFSWMHDAPVLGFLNAVCVPDVGGDTLWASTVAVYDRIAEDERIRCDSLTALHAPDDRLLASIADHHGRAKADQLLTSHPPLERPLVRVHPVTGRRSVFLSPMYMQRIVGPAGADGALLDRLNGQLDEPEVQMRWRWRAGDLVIWDETSTCHRALTDHFPMRRVMRRCVTVDR